MVELNPLDHPICFAVPKRLTPASAWRGHIPFAMFLVDVLKPQTIVELGTESGDSYCAFCQAVKELGLDTSCFAIDIWGGDPQSQVLASLRAHHDPLYKDFSHLIQSTFDETLPRFGAGSIDLLHIDGNHTYAAAKHDFETWLPNVSQRGVILFHDIAVREANFGVWQLWEEVRSERPHFEFSHGQGLGVLFVGNVESRELRALALASDDDARAVQDFFAHLANDLELHISLQPDAEQQSSGGLGTPQSQATVRAKEARIRALEVELQRMRSGIVAHLVARCQRVIDKLLQPGTRRRHYYELGLIGIEVILKDGWRSFFRKFRIWFRLKRATARSHVPGLSAFKGSLTKKEVERLMFPKSSELTEVSIVIPVYNQWRFTANCLKSISQNTIGSYEVIVVDDASSDETVEVLPRVGNLRLIRNKENSGFVESCNRGAKASVGKYVLFLNNDTIVAKDWLSPLVELIGRDDVGAVGPKFLSPAGTLNEAGVIIWNDCSFLQYGSLDNPDRPEYNYVREVDSCGGAAFLVKKDLFEQIGGFDSRFKPAFCEETDLFMSIRDRGYKIMYQPCSAVVHFVGTSYDAYASRKNMATNWPKFIEKWKDTLENKHYPPSPDNIFFARDRRQGQTVLVVDRHVPTYDKDSGSLRMFNVVKLLSELGHKVTFVGQVPLGVQPYTSELQDLGVEVLYSPYTSSVDECLRRSGKFFKIVMLSRNEVASKYMDLARTLCPEAKLIYDTVDLAFLRESRRAAVEGDKALNQRAAELKESDLRLMRASDTTLVVSSVEKELLLKEDPTLRVDILSNIHQVTPPDKGVFERSDLLFVGNFEHVPNVDAVRWFVREVLPEILTKLPSLRLFVVGTDPPGEVVALGSRNVVVTGYAKDLKPYFDTCRVFVAPLRYGAGVKGKINQAMSFGLPVVTTSTGAEGMQVTNGRDLLIADDAARFADETVRLYSDADLWQKLSENSLRNVEEFFSEEAARSSLRRLLMADPE